MKRSLSIFASTFAACLCATSVAYAAPALNPSSVTLGIGQSTTVYSQGSATEIYRMSNSNPNVASVQISGQQIMIIGTQTGSTVLSICYINTTTDCANLSVTVNSGTTTGSTLSFSQSTATVALGQTASVTITGGSGSYYISGNSNSGIASANMNGNSVTFSGLTSGNTTVTICDQSGNCGTVSVVVNTTSGGTTTGTLSFNNQNPTITPGQSLTVTVSGGSDYYVSSNSNPSSASVSLIGNQLSIYGNQAGSSAATICSTSNGCGVVNITVSSTGGNQPVTFGNNSPTVSVGQSINVALGNNSNYFITTISNQSILRASISGSTLTITGASAGSATITVCGSVGGCSTLTATVTGTTTAPTPTPTPTYYPPTTPTSPTNNASMLSTIQSMQAQLAQLLLQIQTMTTALTQLAASVGATGGTTTATPTSPTAPALSSSYQFTQFLDLGSQGAEVTALQQRLTQLGFFSGAATGYFGPLTKTAVEKFQAARGIEVRGYVGPETRTALNAR